MISLFPVSTNDQSILYLMQIFGAVGSVLPTGNNTTILLSVLFHWLNTVALVLGTLMVVYVTVIGVLNTAHEGEFMGKKFSGLWIPIRMVLGIIALFPTATGYCGLQIIMMWIITQGVGIADTLWTKTLVTAEKGGSPFASADTSQAGYLYGGTGTIANLFDNLVCQSTSVMSDPSIKNNRNPYYYCDSDAADHNYCASGGSSQLNINNSNTAQVTRVASTDSSSYDQYVYSMGPNGACGKLSYTACTGSANTPCNADQTSLACLQCHSQEATLQQVVTVLGGVTGMVAQADHDYRAFFQGAKPADWIKAYCTKNNLSDEQCCVRQSQTCTNPNIGKFVDPNDVTAVAMFMDFLVNPAINNSGFIKASADQYKANVMIAPWVTWVSQQGASTLTDWRQKAQDLGWVLAGAYYFNLAKSTSSSVGQLPIPTTTPPTPTLADPNSGNPLLGYGNNYQAISQYLSNQSQAGGSLSGSVPALGGADSALRGAATQILNDFYLQMTPQNADQTGGNSNPIVSISQYGIKLMMVAQVTFGILTLTTFLIILGATINPMVLGTGLTLPPWGEAMKTIFNVLGPFVGALLVAIFSLGAILGIYVPLIPFIIFTTGAIGWMMATVEAMVACPFIALGILSPAGQHELLGRAEHAIMLTFNLFLRPGLMIIGMMASMLLIIPVSNLINAGFMAAVGSFFQKPGLFELIVIIGIYTTFVVTAMNKVFSLIHVIPERVLTWIGGQAVQYGEAEALGESKRAAEGAASGGAGAAKQAGGALEAGGEKTSLAYKADDKAAKQAASVSSSKKD